MGCGGVWGMKRRARWAFTNYLTHLTKTILSQIHSKQLPIPKRKSVSEMGAQRNNSRTRPAQGCLQPPPQLTSP